MRSSQLLLTMMLWAGAAFGAVAGDPTGDEILAKSQEAYTAVQSYVGTTTVQSKSVINDIHLDQTATARIVFLRPGKIRIEGKDTAGQAFAIVSDGKDTWSSWAIQNSGKFAKVQNVENAIAGMTGVAATAPTKVPAALMKLRWGYPFVRETNSKLEGREKIGGIECYRVVSDTRQGRTTYWVDGGSFLLRQMKEEQDEAQMKEIQKRVQEHMDKTLKEQGMQIPKVTMKSRETLHSFSIEKINASVDPTVFEDPTRSK